MTETYIQKRYRTDVIFRENQLKYSKKYAHEHLEQVAKTARIRYANLTPKQITALNTARRIRYANRPPEQITARKEYLERRRRGEK